MIRSSASTSASSGRTPARVITSLVAYDVSGVLLIDMEAERIREIGFDLS